MKPKEKAKELVEKFDSISGFKRFSKYYALICVDEILKCVSFNDYKVKKYDEVSSGFPDCNFYTYWQEVKKEIENL